MAMSRRKFLLAGGLGVVVAGAGAVAAVEARILPGRSTLNKALGLTGGPVGLPQVEPATVESGSYTSALRLGETTNWRLAYPAGMSPEGLPLVVSLHGRGGTAAGSFSDGIGLQYFLADSVERGNIPFAIASIDGGEGYWHARADGSDTGTMITEELLPILAKKGIDVSSLSLFGWSMGGFGAILQGQLSSVPVTAVASSGAALWPEFARTAEGAFDDEADFAAHGLMPTVASSVEVPTRMACGFDDGFIHNNQQYAEELPYLVQTQFEAGLHDDDFWRRMMPGQLDFLAQHIAPTRSGSAYRNDR